MDFLSKLWEKLTRSESVDRLDRYYVRQFATPTSLLDLLFVLTRKSDYSTITQLPIKFKELPFGVNTKEVINKLGTPVHSLKNDDKVPNHQILYYKLIISGFKVVVQMHFLHDMLFYSLYNFRTNSMSDITKLFDVLELKYEVDLGHSRNTFVSEIRDKENNKIVSKIDINFTLGYIWGSKKPFELLTLLASQKRKKVDISTKGHVTLIDMDGNPDENSVDYKSQNHLDDDALYNSL